MTVTRKTILRLASLLGAAATLAGCQDAPLQTAALIATYKRTLDAYSQTDSTVTDIINKQHADGRDAALISAFFGLDNALPKRTTDKVACKGGGGADGMPVIFSHEVDIKTLEPGDFRVTTQSGAIGEITCLTLAPADDPGELRTALLTGNYGSLEDQPASVEIVGNVLSLDNSINFKGAMVNATRLEAGPTLVWAEIVPASQWELGKKATRLPWGGGSRCPNGTKQVVRAAWNGGVKKPSGASADEAERDLYKVTVVSENQTSVDVTPYALADLNDGDNNHLLCLDTALPAVSVFFPAGHLTDPRDDLNPSTTIAVTATQPN
jgi:hypothetical protein